MIFLYIKKSASNLLPLAGDPWKWKTHFYHPHMFWCVKVPHFLPTCNKLTFGTQREQLWGTWKWPYYFPTNDIIAHLQGVNLNLWKFVRLSRFLKMTLTVLTTVSSVITGPRCIILKTDDPS